eukprot:Nk52_evm47s242 gene=Nk52_evmTU47s242
MSGGLQQHITPASLNTFIVYNTEFGQTESTQHKNIVFYHPEDTPLDEKTNNVGLCEAFVQFTSSFGASQKCETVRTERFKQVFLNPEENFWLVMTVNVPSCNSSIYKKYCNQSQSRSPFLLSSSNRFSAGVRGGGDSSTPTSPRQRRAGGDNTDVIYFPEHVKDSVLHSILEQAYKAFRLFNGTLMYVLEMYGLRTLKHKLSLFFQQYLATINFQRLDLLNSLDGIQFLPLDRNTYLSIQCFINMTEERFKVIRHSAFLFNDYLVVSGMEQEDIRPLYRCLKNGFLGGGVSLTAPLKKPSKGKGDTGAEGVGSQGGGARGRAGSSSRRPLSGGYFFERGAGNSSSGLSGGGGSVNSLNESMANASMGIRSGFILGPEDLNDAETPVTAPRLFLNGCFSPCDEDDQDGEVGNADGETENGASNEQKETNGTGCTMKKGKSKKNDAGGRLSVSSIRNTVDDELYLIVYRSHSITLCFVIEGEALMNIGLYQELDAFVGPHVRALSQTMTQHLIGSSFGSGSAMKNLMSSGGSPKAKKKLNSSISILDNNGSVAGNQSHRYVYYNEMNLAVKSTIHTSKGISSIPPEALHLINAIHAEFVDNDLDNEEICRTGMVSSGRFGDEGVSSGGDALMYLPMENRIDEVMMHFEHKSIGSFWVVGKKSEARQFFSVFSQKNATIADIGEEMKKLNALYFNSIFVE